METKKTYKVAVDYLRLLSILAVVSIHTSTKTIAANKQLLPNIPFTLFLNQISRFAVPLFFMISGFVLELNYDTNESYLTFLKKRLNRIFIPYIFWSAVYYFIVYPKTQIPHFFKSLLMGDASYQLYFIPALLILYLIFPFIHKYMKIIGNSWVILFLFLVQVVLLGLEYNSHQLSIYYPLRIALLNYFLFIFGITMSRNYEFFIKFISKWKLVLSLGALILAFNVFNEGWNRYLSTHNYLEFYSQWRPSILIYTIFLGGFLYWLFDKKIFKKPVIKTLSQLSFFVFFIHVIFIELMWSFIRSYKLHLLYSQNLWWDPVCFLTITLLSFSIAYIVHKIPYLSKITG